MQSFEEERKRQFERLEHNIIQTIYEWQVKIGYAKEAMKLYFMRDSLCFYCGDLTKEEIGVWLSEFKQYVKERLGEVKVSGDGKRYCVSVPEEGTRYVYEQSKEDTFLLTLLNVMKQTECTMEDIKKVFAEKSEDFVCEEIKNGEFDYVVYYKEPAIDEFRYCFTIHSHGIFYHRFNLYDYQSVI